MSKQRTVVVVLNGISLRKKDFYRRQLPELQKVANVDVFETLSMRDGVTIASREANKYPDLILAAGGDGTLNQVVNGVLRGRETEQKLPVIGCLPIGSGNDFARTAQLTSNIADTVNLIRRFMPKRIDVGKVTFTPLKASAASEQYFVNVADLGMGPVVVDKVQKSGRALGHAVAYYKSILSTFASYKLVKVKAVSENWSWEGPLRSLAIGNGKCYGHGLHVAPDAVLDDRMFNVFICGNVSVFDFIRYTGKLKKGKHIQLPEIHYKTAISVELFSDDFCLIEGDGEIFGKLPAKVEMVERQLEMLI